MQLPGQIPVDQFAALLSAAVVRAGQDDDTVVIGHRSEGTNLPNRVRFDAINAHGQRGARANLSLSDAVRAELIGYSSDSTMSSELRRQMEGLLQKLEGFPGFARVRSPEQLALAIKPVLHDEQGSSVALGERITLRFESRSNCFQFEVLDFTGRRVVRESFHVSPRIAADLGVTAPDHEISGNARSRLTSEMTRLQHIKFGGGHPFQAVVLMPQQETVQA